MHTKLTSLFSLVLASLVALAIYPAAVQAATFTVNTTDDTTDAIAGNGTCADSLGDCSLRAAVEEANALSGADTITLPVGTYTLSLHGTFEDEAATGDLDITGDLTINGAAQDTTIIDADADDRAFQVSDLDGASLVLNHLTVTNGSLNTSAGAGIFYARDLTLNYVTIRDNTLTNDYGGAAYGAGLDCYGGENGSATIAHSLFSNNVAGTRAYGGAIDNGTCDLDIRSSTFSENTANSGWGGALELEMFNYTDINIVDSTFTDNSAGHAGAIIVVNFGDSSPAMNITNTTFSGNTALNYHGGAIYDSSGAPMNLTNDTFIDNATAASGGAIYIEDNANAVIELANNTIIQNTADSDNDSSSELGGGFYIADGGHGAITMHGNIIVGNTANGSSGADCYAASALTSQDYNIFGDRTGCTFTTQTHDVTAAAGLLTAIAAATLADHGGLVETVAITDAVVIDAIPVGNCTYRGGEPLTFDARGVNRPNNTNCDIGAYEVETNPTLSSTTPTDGATGVAVGANLVLNFSEAMIVGTGNITIKNSNTNATVATIDVTSGLVTGSGTATITIDPSSDLGALVGYYVQIPNTAFVDPSANAYPGISSTSAWNFTTAGTAGVTLDATTSFLAEGAIINYFGVTLATEPIADVTVHFESLTGDTQFDQSSLTFTSANWDTPQAVFMTAVDDHIDKGVHVDDITFSSASSDSRYNALIIDTIAVTIIDNDTAGIIASTASSNTAETGSQATFTVVLNSQPTDNVQIAITSNDTTEGQVDLSSLTFTASNWNVPQTVTITGQDDAVDDGDLPYLIVTAAATSSDTHYNGLNANDVTLLNVDNEDTVVSDDSGEDADHGDINDVEDAHDGSLTIHFDDAATITITPFEGSANFKYDVSEDNSTLVATNGKRLKVFVNGEQVDTVVVGKQTLQKGKYVVSEVDLYNQYHNVVLLTTANGTAKVTVLRLNADNQLVKKTTSTFEVANTQALHLKFNQEQKSIRAIVGTGAQKTILHLKLTKSGQLQTI